VVLAVQNEREWQRLCLEVLERPDLATDARFASNELRLANRGALEPQIEAALSRFDVDEAEQRLEAASMAYSRMNDVSEVLRHPQVLERDRLLDIALPGGARAQVLRAPFNIEGAEEPASAIPEVGQHTDAILGELGYDAAAIAKLRAEGAV
jgi:formyl-CoA transferase